MGVEKMRLLACEAIYWIEINAGTENAVKNHTVCLFSGNTNKGQDPVT